MSCCERRRLNNSFIKIVSVRILLLFPSIRGRPRLSIVYFLFFLVLFSLSFFLNFSDILSKLFYRLDDVRIQKQSRRKVKKTSIIFRKEQHLFANFKNNWFLFAWTLSRNQRSQGDHACKTVFTKIKCWQHVWEFFFVWL